MPEDNKREREEAGESGRAVEQNGNVNGTAGGPEGATSGLALRVGVQSLKHFSHAHCPDKIFENIL